MDRSAMLAQLREVRELLPNGFSIHDLVALTEFTGPEWRRALLDNKQLLSWSGKDIVKFYLPANLSHRVCDTVFASNDQKVQYLKFTDATVFTKQAKELGISGSFRESGTPFGERFGYSADAVTDEQLAAAGFYRTADEVIEHLWR